MSGPLSMSALVKRYVGKTGAWVGVSDLSIDVTIEDVRNVFGSQQFLISPLTGTGQKWVHSDSVSFPDTDAGELL